jgi:peptidoglycan/LPS O-acetylase OafA/YrhL
LRPTILIWRAVPDGTKIVLKPRAEPVVRCKTYRLRDEPHSFLSRRKVNIRPGIQIVLMKQNTNLEYIDQLRGIAILMVVLVHTALYVPNLSSFAEWTARYCQMGVQLFFVASAYTLCLTFVRRRSEPANVLSFYTRRFFRIAPLYYVGIGVYFCVLVVDEYLSIGAVESFLPYSFPNVMANVLFVHGMIPAANNNIVPGGWSIGTEMLFYAVFPALYWLGERMIDARAWIGLAYLVLASVAVNLALQLHLYSVSIVITNDSFLYYSLINQLPVFVIGMIAFFVADKAMLPETRTMPLTLVLGCITFTAITLFLWRMERRPLFAIIPTTAACSFFCLLQLLRIVKFDAPLLSHIGRISYSIYVFHFIFAWYAVPKTVQFLFGDNGGDFMLLGSVISVSALTIAVAVVTEKYVEAKGIALGARVVQRLQRLIKPHGQLAS